MGQQVLWLSSGRDYGSADVGQPYRVPLQSTGHHGTPGLFTKHDGVDVRKYI